jgi:hypothetical protein
MYLITICDSNLLCYVCHSTPESLTSQIAILNIPTHKRRIWGGILSNLTPDAWPEWYNINDDAQTCLLYSQIAHKSHMLSDQGNVHTGHICNYYTPHIQVLQQ